MKEKGSSFQFMTFVSSCVKSALLLAESVGTGQIEADTKYRHHLIYGSIYLGVHKSKGERKREGEGDSWNPLLKKGTKSDSERRLYP